MTRTYPLRNLGCASCAAKMERQIARVPGVRSCTVNFMTGKLVLEAEEGQLPLILQEAGRIVQRIEPQASLQC